MIDGRRGWSLRRRVMLIAGLASLATLILGGAAMYVAAQAEDDKLRDARLADLGRTILFFAEHEIDEIRAEGRTDMIHLETEQTLGNRFDYQVWSTEDRKLLLRSHKASAESPMAPLDGVVSLRTVRLEGEPYRVFSFAGQSRMLIQVAERLEGRDSTIGLVSFYFLTLLVIPFSMVALVTWWQLNRAMRAIDGSVRQLARRNSIDLSPMNVQDPPQELELMIGAINGLLGRIGDAMSVERGFTAVAAHELRSPLAGLRAQAQLASMCTSDGERNEALAAVMQGVDRCSHLLEQLLDLTHSEALEPGEKWTEVEIERALEYALADLRREIERRRVRLTVRLEAQRVHAVEWGVVLLLRNLLSNAIRHTPEGSAVEVSSSRQSAGVLLTVDDAGPGIPPALRARAFERFERLGRNDAYGVGLGLSIVRSIVQSQAATIHLVDSPLGGLRVQVLFGSQPEGPPGRA